MVGRMSAPQKEPLKLIEYVYKKEDLSAKKIKKTKKTEPDGAILETLEIEDLSQKKESESLKITENKKQYLFSYSYGLTKELNEVHKAGIYKVYDIPILGDVYVGPYVSIENKDLKEAGLGLNKLF